MNSHPFGSEWRKWDLHLHSPYTKLSDNYKDSGEPLDKFCDVIEASDIQVFGITDYFSFDAFQKFHQHFSKKHPDSNKRFFFNLELRLNETVNKQLEEVNIHLIFNPDSLNYVPKFLSRLKVVKTGKDEVPITCSELKTKDEFEAATIQRDSIIKAFKETFGEQAVRRDHFLVFTAANNDGIRPERGKKRKEEICDEIDKFSDGFFGNSQNIAWYLNVDRLEDPNLKVGKKPVITGSDCHSFDDLENFLGKKVDDGKNSKNVTWIKADPTYEGLKQILYEPEEGERVSISPLNPNQKDSYKIIRKLKFANSSDFPSEILFNSNLCAIIGSRSSGKSALLAYVAHSVLSNAVEKMMLGPGLGEEYHWNKIPKNYQVEWANGKANIDSPGNIIYIPQNYLFDKSRDPKEVKEKIKPVLFKTLPDFQTKYEQTQDVIEGINSNIATQVDDWFTERNNYVSVIDDIKEIGNKTSIEDEKKKIETKIEDLKKKSKLSQEELISYQTVSAEIASKNNRVKEIDGDLATLSQVSTENNYFSSAKINLLPLTQGLPKNLRSQVERIVTAHEQAVLKDVNKHVLDYKNNLIAERSRLDAQLETLRNDNKELIEKNKQNAELEQQIKGLNAVSAILKQIEGLEKSKTEIEGKLQTYQSNIKTEIKRRSEQLGSLKETMQTADQGDLSGIVFGIEIGLTDSQIEELAGKINAREATDFVKSREVDITAILQNPDKFLNSIYIGTQKINSGHDKKTVCKAAFQLTETILFNAEMEGDRIGGFKEPTMTPGKRALFALRLILAESNETWPLLIDQPEDDLDSRSIFNEIVPFLKQKKRERQIIMVSHDANLVIGSGSEQIIIANRHGSDRQNKDGKQFNYLTGSLEHSEEFDNECDDTLNSQGVSQHTCAILDGGKTAFENRKNRYNIR